MNKNEIMSQERVSRFKQHTWNGGSEFHAGLLLTMGDGSKWFHPFDGSKPVQETPAP